MDWKEYIFRAEICKNEIAKYHLFEGRMLDEIKSYYRISTTWSSNALEGNSLSIGETKILLEKGIVTDSKPLHDTLEAYGHSDAYDFIFELSKNHEITLNDIAKLHQLFYQRIHAQYVGEYRDRQARVLGSEFSLPAPDKIQDEMIKFELWMRNKGHELHPIVYAAEIHKRFLEIAPYVAGNGQIARLLMNMVLIQHRYLPCIIFPQTRLEYMQALEVSHETPNRKGVPEIFIAFIAKIEMENEFDFMHSLGINIPDFNS